MRLWQKLERWSPLESSSAIRLRDTHIPQRNSGPGAGQVTENIQGRVSTVGRFRTTEFIEITDRRHPYQMESTAGMRDLDNTLLTACATRILSMHGNHPINESAHELYGLHLSIRQASSLDMGSSPNRNCETFFASHRARKFPRGT